MLVFKGVGSFTNYLFCNVSGGEPFNTENVLFKLGSGFVERHWFCNVSGG